MRSNSTLAFFFCGLSALSTSCGSPDSASETQSSVLPQIESRWSEQVDLSKERSPDTADVLKASKSATSMTKVGANLSAALKFGSSVIFDIGAGLGFDEIFKRSLLHQVTIVRPGDSDGSGDGRGLFVDGETVAANRFFQCSSQKVISQGSELHPDAKAGISFMGISLSAGVDSNIQHESVTDYSMTRGYYETKQDMRLSEIFALCDEIAASDAALQNVDQINKIVKLNFAASADLEQLAQEVAKGKKVNNFKYQNLKFDFEILRKSDSEIVFQIFPDTHYADPRLEASVRYSMKDQRMVVEDIVQTCKADCQNYIDENGKHGLHSYGEHAKREQAEKAIKIISAIFAATAVGSR